MITLTKLEVATRQLRSAVMLFCTGMDRFSAITLAGAADVIVSQLLLSQGKQNFSDALMKKELEKTGVMPQRGAYGRATNDMLMVNALKHMDPGDDDYVEMNLRVSALATVSKAVANYAMLCGHEADFVRAFKLWARMFTPKGLDEGGEPIQ